MAMSEIHLNSTKSLQKMTSLTAILPEGKKGPFPVYYLLHGLSDNQTAWTRRTNIERYVEDLPLIVIMPNGDRSFYNNSEQIGFYAYETFVTEELIDFVDHTFHTIPSAKGRAIGGLSMGGYGALKNALKHPDLYCAAVSHSGCHEAATQPLDPRSERYLHFGEHKHAAEDDVIALIKKTDPSKAPAIWIDCGTEDFLIEQNRNAHKALSAKGIVHEYSERAGNHNWDFWDRSLILMLPWLAEKLEININDKTE